VATPAVSSNAMKTAGSKLKILLISYSFLPGSVVL
jgi:hypothetical protein